MTRLTLLGLGLLLALAGCGVDGEPLAPSVSASQTFGISSNSGTFSKSVLSFEFGG